MRFRVERDALAEAVAWSARTLPQRPQLPVLAGLRLDVTGSSLGIAGFDYEVSTQVDLDVDASEGGQALVSGRLLAEITRSLPGAPVEMTSDGSRVVVTCGSARFTLATLPLEEYPTLPDMPSVAGTVGSDAFAAAVASVAVAAGRDDTLPVLTGVRVEIEGERLTLAATDRYRLAVRELRWQPDDPQISATALVPARTLAETARSLTSGAEVTVALSSTGPGDSRSGEGMVGFVGGTRRTTTRLLDGEFPKYRALLPAESPANAQVETAALIEAVKRVSLVAARNAPVRLTFSGEGLVLEAGGLDDAQASEALPASYEGDDLTIAFNPTYLLDGLGAIDSDTAHMAFTTATKPAVITGKPAGTDAGGGAEGGDYRYLIMPVRLSG